MDISKCIEILETAKTFMWIRIGIYALIPLVIFFICLFIKKESLKTSFFLIIISAAFLIWGIYYSSLMDRDIKEQSFISQDAEYSKTTNANVGNIPCGELVYIIEEDGDQITLYESEGFPDGEYKGTVTYGKHSKVIIGFEKAE